MTLSRRNLPLFLTAAFAFALKIALALGTYGTNDVYAWQRFANWSQIFGVDVYRADAAFNHPPSMIYFLGAIGWLSRHAGISFAFWMRLPAIMADAGSLWILTRLFRGRADEAKVRYGLLLLAASPILILVSGFHGNTDPVVMFFVLLSLLLTETGAADWLAGSAFGTAMCIKVMPVIVLPVFFFSKKGAERKLMFCVGMLGTMLLSWTPYLFEAPAQIIGQVFGYHSLYGHWGLTWLAEHLTFFRDEWHDYLQKYETWVVLGMITGWAWWVNRPEKPTRTVYEQAGCVLFFFLAVATGFGVQYLAWLAPWTIGLDLLPVAFFTVSSGVFLFLVYNYWAGGLPWFLSDGNYVGDYTPHLDYFLVLCWISVAVLAWWAWVRPSGAFWSRTRTGWVAAAAAVPLIAIPAWRQMSADARRYPAAVDRAAITMIRSDEDSQLADVYYGMGRYSDAVVAARTAVAMDPKSLNAWNNLARACIQLRRWDEARNAAGEALQIKPDDPIAEANFQVTQRAGSVESLPY